MFGRSSSLSHDVAAKLNALDKSQAVIEFSIDGTILDANNNFLNTVGYTLDVIKGRHHSMFVEPEVVHSQEYKDFWSKLGCGERGGSANLDSAINRLFA
jgi:methyl-accepting chemotaxis protein